MAKSKEKIDREAILASVRKKEFAPVYFFYGEEDYLIEELIDAILAAAVDPGMKEFNVDILQGSDTDGKRISEIALSYPMMAERRVVIVKDFERVTGKDVLESYLETPSPTTLLILIASSPDLRKKPYTILRNRAIGGECAPLNDNQVMTWIDGRMKAVRRTIDPPAAALLHAYVGNSLREIANEIDKLMIAAGDRSAITVEDVRAVVGISREFTVFELAQAVGEKKIARALEIVDRLIGTGGSAVMIVAALTSHFSKLWKISDGLRLRKSEFDIAQSAGIPPFYLKQYLPQVQKYPSAEIENAFLVLTRADESLKSNPADHTLVLSLALTEIIEANELRSIPS